MHLIKKLKKLLLISLISFGTLELISKYLLGFGDPVLYKMHPTIEYEMLPSQKVRRFHRDIFINSESMRSNELDKKKKSNTTRILIYGDSVIFGGSLVDQEDLATQLLYKRLNDKDSRYEIANISAGSWGPGNWLAHLKERGNFKADKVILVLNTDDWKDNPNFNSLNCTLSSPTKKPYFALTEIFYRYFYQKISNYRVRMSKKENCMEKKYTKYKGLEDLDEFFDILKNMKVPITLIQFWDSEELIAGEPKFGYELIRKLAYENNIRVISTQDYFNNCSEDPKYLFTDYIHPFTKLGQKCLSYVFEDAVKDF